MEYVGITLAGRLINIIMENKGPATAEANRDKHINYLAEEEAATGADPGNDKSIESRRRMHGTDAGNDGSSNEIPQKEKRIDPGNEHHHRTDADDKIFDDDIDRSPQYDADAGGDGTGYCGT